jgi:hypothetical protein
MLVRTFGGNGGLSLSNTASGRDWVPAGILLSELRGVQR